MQLHRNAKLGLAGRFALVKTIEAGWCLAVFPLSPGASGASGASASPSSL
jgi:hypothetical protein